MTITSDNVLLVIGILIYAILFAIFIPMWYRGRFSATPKNAQQRNGARRTVVAGNLYRAAGSVKRVAHFFWELTVNYCLINSQITIAGCK